MGQALTVGTRTIMMHEGRIILDISGPGREMKMFEQTSGRALSTDRILLTR